MCARVKGHGSPTCPALGTGVQAGFSFTLLHAVQSVAVTSCLFLMISAESFTAPGSWGMRPSLVGTGVVGAG